LSYIAQKSVYVHGTVAGWIVEHARVRVCGCFIFGIYMLRFGGMLSGFRGGWVVLFATHKLFGVVVVVVGAR
jgi:hypothetical protein